VEYEEDWMKDLERWTQFIEEEFESEDCNIADYNPRQLLKKFYWWLDSKKLLKERINVEC
jgi:hypothetical protein